MTFKHMQRWSTSFQVGEIQIKTIPGYNVLPDRLAKIRHILLVNLWWNKRFSPTVAGTAKTSVRAHTSHEISKFSYPSLLHLASRSPCSVLNQCEMARAQGCWLQTSTSWERDGNGGPSLGGSRLNILWCVCAMEPQGRQENNELCVEQKDL